jgi:hypothetical protein
MRALPRRFTLLDAMIMIAATAIGMVGSISIWNSAFYEKNPYLEFSVSFLRDHRAVMSYVGHYSYVLSACAIMWTMALSLLSLKRPRPPIWRLARQPGVIGCWAASMAFLFTGCIKFMNFYFHNIILYDWADYLLDLSFSEVSCAVLVSWVIAAVSKRWRPEPNWIDRIGRVLGLIWIVARPLALCYWW